MTARATRSAIFDMDGVLVDSGAHHRAAWAALLEEEGVTADGDFWRHTIGRAAEDAVRLLLPRELDEAECARLAERKRAHYTRLVARGAQPVPGVRELLAALDAQAVPRAVATSAGRREAETLLDQLDIRACFTAVVTAEDVRWGKPNPEIYLRAAAALGVAAGACLVFEDSLVGVHAARNAGMRVVGVTTSHTGRELIAAGAERAIADFRGFAWPV